MMTQNGDLLNSSILYLE